MGQNTENLRGDNFRYERKFFIDQIDRSHVVSAVLTHPALFSEIYHERYVNNIYFDFISMDNFMDNINGNTHRTKYRIRWYGEMKTVVKKSKLEIKIKKGFVGSKISFGLIPFEVNNEISFDSVKKVIHASDISSNVKFSLNEQQPVLFNRYRRRYYATGDRKFRITIDDDQAFYKFNPTYNPFLQKYTDNENIILELKYDKEHEMLAPIITNKFPYRLTKSSKYSRGIQLLYF